MSDVSEDQGAPARRQRRFRLVGRASRRARGRRPPVVPWRMIGFLLGLGVLTSFAAVNIEHRSDVSFGFFSFADVPVFLSILVAFIAGALIVLPLALRRGQNMRDADLANAPTEGQVRAAVAARAQRRRRLGGERGVDSGDEETDNEPAGEGESSEGAGRAHRTVAEDAPLGLAAPVRGSSRHKNNSAARKPGRRGTSKVSGPRRR